MTSDAVAAPPDINHPRVRGWHYWLPMAVFLGVIFLNQYANLPYPVAYVARTLIVAGLLAWLWKFYTRIRWNHLGLGVLVGVIGTVQWIGMELSLIWLRDQFPEGSFLRGLIGMTSLVKPDTALSELATPGLQSLASAGGVAGLAPFRSLAQLLKSDPGIHVLYREITTPALLWAFILVRWLGSALVVPVMEELFWRDWLWRNVAAPNDFRLHRVGEYDRNAFWLIPLFFAVVHVQWLTAIVWALLIAWLLVRTRSIGACIVAHGVTNLLLGAWVLLTWKLNWRPMGYSQWFFW